VWRAIGVAFEQCGSQMNQLSRLVNRVTRDYSASSTCLYQKETLRYMSIPRNDATLASTPRVYEGQRMFCFTGLSTSCLRRRTVEIHLDGTTLWLILHIANIEHTMSASSLKLPTQPGDAENSVATEQTEQQRQ
jgi:hypothetical protein